MQNIAVYNTVVICNVYSIPKINTHQSWIIHYVSTVHIEMMKVLNLYFHIGPLSNLASRSDFKIYVQFILYSYLQA